MKVVSIRQALQHVADNPVLTTDVLLNVPVYEMVSRTLFEIANDPQVDSHRSLSRANVARGMILNRLVGRRPAGSHPATQVKTRIEFQDLTGGMIGDS